MKEFPRRFLSLRDKTGAHRRSKSVPPGSDTKPRPISSETFRSIFKNDKNDKGDKNTVKSDIDVEKEDEDKVRDIQHRLDELNITNVSVDHIKAIMATKFAEGDIEKTAEFIDMEQKASSGIIASYDPNVNLLGAENRGGVTCYIDALLFAMFAKLDAFECMLKPGRPLDDKRSKLLNLIRIWVNMLRTGKLIRTDLTTLIQESFAECGWADARLLEQQDTSEAFAFITETLQLPLLSLQVDLYHHGKRDDDDHKVVYERLLNLAVPPDPEGKGIKLEDCLEEYFNSSVDVQRDSEEMKKLTMDDSRPNDMPTLVESDTIRLIRAEESSSSTATITASPIDVSAPPLIPESPTESSESPAVTQTQETTEETAPPVSQRRPSTRQRSTSVIQRVTLDESGRPLVVGDNPPSRRTTRKGSIVVKAVTIPAWQFFRLIPWHARGAREPRNDGDVAMSFDQRPVVGICLKRYAMTSSGLPKRHNTFIDIPVSLRLPHFMLAGDAKTEDNDNGLSTEYKLILQSVVCHRGDSLQSGHYISFARVAPKLLTGNRRHDFDPPPDYEEARWVKFDDLEADNRVTYVDDIKKALKEEMPYLLFYQIVPMVDASCPSTSGTETEPPSYVESSVGVDISPTPTTSDSSTHRFSNRTTSLASESQRLDTGVSRQSNAPSIRLSSEFERPSRRYFEGVDFGSLPVYTGSTPGGSRRQSMNYTDSTVATPAITPAITPETHSPIILPSDDQSTASRLSRAATRFALGKQSRPTSQSGEGRLSSTMSRLGLTKSSREPLAEPTTLNIATSVPARPVSSDLSNAVPDSPVDTERPTSQSQRPLHKTRHKNGKSKERAGKTKSASQPERECIIM